MRNQTDIKFMAIFISVLEKEGIKYSIGAYSNRYVVEILG